MKKKIIYALSAVMLLMTLVMVVSFSCSAKTATETDTTYICDVNGDNTVNILDLVRLKKYKAGMQDVEIVFINADINADGVIGAEDLVLLKAELLSAVSALSVNDYNWDLAFSNQ